MESWQSEDADGNPTSYDRVRSFVGNNYGESSHGYPINWKISSKEANRWRNL